MIIVLDSSGWVSVFVVFGILGVMVFVVYVFSVDVFMYWCCYCYGCVCGMVYMFLNEGVCDAWSCCVLSGSWVVWKVDVLWLMFYFSVGVWISIVIVCVFGV